MESSTIRCASERNGVPVAGSRPVLPSVPGRMAGPDVVEGVDAACARRACLASR